MNHKARQAITQLEAAGAAKETEVRPGIAARWYLGGKSVAWLEHTGRFGVQLAGQRYVTVTPDNIDANGQWIYSDRAQPGSTPGSRASSVETVMCPNCFISIPVNTECATCEETP